MSNFGDIFWIPKSKQTPNVASHWVVLLYENSGEKIIYCQTLQSRIFKIFPNFGSLSDLQCRSCSANIKARDYLKYKNNKFLFLDIDTVTFLNFNKYYFLRRETFVCLKRIEKFNYFDFNDKVSRRIYKFAGTLSDHNKKHSLLAMRASSELNLQEKHCMADYYSLTK